MGVLDFWISLVACKSDEIRDLVDFVAMDLAKCLN